MLLRGESRPEFLKEETLYDLLHQTAENHPVKTALVWGDTHISYEQLRNDAIAVGGALAALGGRPGGIIGLLLPRGKHLLVAQAGITASGAAWLPFDAEIPLERAAVCLASANAIGLVTTREWAERTSGLSVPIWFIEDLLAPEALRTPPQAASPESPAYIIYTSGSTGTPKGIAISQKSICHFLRSENATLGIRSEDKVYQGFSVAFDMSFEEIWISYLVGATLWIAPPDVISDPDAIALALHSQEITILHAVPTLAALIEQFPAHLRLINIGGEACSEALSQRLTGQGRRIFNTYGPTETTVSASLAELHPNTPVTIGTPLPNYGMVILNEAHQMLPYESIGEIAIFGPGLALGYLNLPELTAGRFIPNPFSNAHEESHLYLTGDLGKITASGEVHCLGRIDNQVKLRGFRIELDEIAAALCNDPAVATAAAVVRELYGSEEIVAFAVLSANTADPQQLRQSLMQVLPAYMVPARVEIVELLPRLSSGKINLAALRQIPLQEEALSANEKETLFSPETPGEILLWDALKQLFPNRSFQPTHDFFCDLGGHSLLAARLVSILRRDANYTHVGVQTVYRERSLSKIATALGAQRSTEPDKVKLHTKASLRTRFLCGTAQFLCLPWIILLQLIQWLAPFLTYHYLTGSKSDSIPFAVAASIGTYIGSIIISFPIAILLKRTLTRRLQPGTYPLWGRTYFSWWLSTQLSGISPTHLISGSPWQAFYLRALGAKVGKNTLLNSVTIAVPELITIEDNVSIGTFVNIENARVEGGLLHIGQVHIKRNANIDSYSILENDTTVGVGAHLLGQSALRHSRSIPDGQTWTGAPATQTTPIQEKWEPAPTPNTIQKAGSLLFYAFGAIAVSILFFVPTFPAFVLIDWIDIHTLDLFESTLEWWQAFPFFLGMSIPASMVLVILTALIAGGLRLLLPRQTASRFSIYSWTYKYKWFLSTIFDTSLEVLHGLYASVYVGFWLRLMGAEIGKGAEVSTAEGITPALLHLGNGSFIADGALLGDEEQHDGWMLLKGTHIGNRTFIGNGAYVPDGAIFPDDVLLGVQSAAPANTTLEPNQTWMGSPPILLPARETVEIPDSKLTFEPSILRRIIRGTIEAIRIVLPMAFIISAGYVIVYKSMSFAEEEEWLACFTTLIISSLLYAISTFSLVVFLKWIIIGRYSPKKAPMWTLFVWLSEAITVAYESLAVPSLLDHLRGTPMLPWALRLLGVKVGKGVWINTTDITEFDCVTIGDFAELNAHSGPQTHLFEDRIMRIGEVIIGSCATIGARSTVLYDSSVGDSCRLGPLTLVAKGEHLPANTAWEGTPAALPLQN
ncbi:MAG: Pls/PosA family non-ribosomal peptide synthetase [Verrucomicrobiota bacterium]